MSDDCDSGDTQIIHGDHDKYGLGKSVGAICGVLSLIVIALACSGNLGSVLMALIGILT